MSEQDHADPRRYVVFCLEQDAALLEKLVCDVRQLCRDDLEVKGCRTPADLDEAMNALDGEPVQVALVLCDQEIGDEDGAAFLMRIHDLPEFRKARKVLLGYTLSLDVVQQAMNRGALNGVIEKPWNKRRLEEPLRHLLTEFFIDHAPESLERISGIVDVDQLSRAFVGVDRDLKFAGQQLTRLRRTFLTQRDLTDEAVENAMLEELDRTLGHPDRETHPAGDVMLTEGQQLGEILVLTSGQVELYRNMDGRDVIFHAHTVGPIVGLMALSNRRHEAFFSCRAVTDVEIVRVSFEDLHRALKESPLLSIHFVTVLLRSLANRARRAVELQSEVRTLNRELTSERDQLARALDQLEQTQMRLVESEKMATLGQLSAGLAHELNNPVAAILRTADYLRDDLHDLLKDPAGGGLAAEITERAFALVPLSTRDERERRRELSSVVDDDGQARRLVRMGIRSRDDVRELLGDRQGEEREQLLADIERYHALGTSLRNLTTCARRISDLVTSLRSYARSGKEMADDVDLHEGLEETLLLFGNALKEVRVEKDYADLPGVACRVAEINQVWTNLISNALQAMDGKGALEIRSRKRSEDEVEVSITDHGPGIKPEHQAQIFEVNFTTRQGEAAFGLGIGLPICKEIIERHRGRIEVESRPGRTCFTVVLPVYQPESMEALA